MNRFVHLNVHSHYSIMDGCSNIKELVDATIKERMPGMAITDNGNMFGIILTTKGKRKARNLSNLSSGVSYMWLRMEQRTIKTATRV